MATRGTPVQARSSLQQRAQWSWSSLGEQSQVSLKVWLKCFHSHQLIVNRSVRFSRPLPRAPPPPSLLVSNRFNLLDHRFVLLDKNISVINDEPTVFTTPLDIWTLRESRKKGELRPHAGTGFKSHDVFLSRPNQKDILMNFNLSFFRGRGATLVRSKSSSPNRQV